jgi:hypothetical protein
VLYRHRLPAWHFYAAAHLPVGTVALSLRTTRTDRWTGAIGFLRHWYPVLSLAPLYKEVEIFAAAFGDWRLTAVIRQAESSLFSGIPAAYLSRQWPWVPLSEYLHFCYFSYVFLFPLLGGYWYFSGRMRPFRELLFALSLVYFGSYLFYSVSG